MEDEEKVIIKLKKEPLESERKERKQKALKKIGIIFLCVLLFAAGIGCGIGITYLKSKATYIAHSDNKYDVIKEYIEANWYYKNNYEDLDSTLDDKAYAGMTSFDEDPYTTYMSNEEQTKYYASINMNYVGVGITYTINAGIATVKTVFKDSPADKYGMKNGDIILKIDGTEIEGMTSDEIKNLAQGEEGSTVVITVKRGDEVLDLSIVRGSFESTAYAEASDNCVYLSLRSFGKGTAEEVKKYLDDYTDYSKIIIDLRDNGGGYQDSVQDVAGLFIGPDKTVLNLTYADGSSVSFASSSNTTYYSNFKDIVLLVDKETASAAEVFTICLKEQINNVTIVGTTTYGKGVVQSAYALSDGSVLKLTTSGWTSPNGVSVEGVGITPDYVVKEDELFYINDLKELDKDTTYEYDSVSEYVEVTQRCLNYLDYSVDRMDGYFDESTVEALNLYKEDNDLKANGVLDYDTLQSLISDVVYLRNSDSSKDVQLNKAKQLINAD